MPLRNAVARVDITKKQARITIGMGSYISATNGARRAVELAKNIHVPMQVDTTLVSFIMKRAMEAPDTAILAPNLARFINSDVCSSVAVSGSLMARRTVPAIVIPNDTKRVGLIPTVRHIGPAASLPTISLAEVRKAFL